MAARPDRLLRGVEVGTKAGYLALAALGVYILWKVLGPKKREGDIEEIVPVLPSIGPAGSGDAPEPGNAAPPEGIVGGSLLSGVTAQIIAPAEGSRVYRGVLSSKFDATIEVVNVTREPQAVQVEVVADYYEFTGGERLRQRTRFPMRTVPGDTVQRFEVEIDSGNFNGLAAEFGQANAVALVYVNGKVTQSTSFEVW
jgi:hypothetical protein